MKSERKAAARARGSGSSRVIHPTQHLYIKPTTTGRRPQPQAGEILCYSGLELIGWLQARHGRFLAFRADGSLIGSFASSRLATSSIYDAQRLAVRS